MKRGMGRGGPGAAIAAWLPLMLLVLSACAPDTGFRTLADYDVVVTLFDQNADFTDYATFALPDSVVHLQIPGGFVTDQLTSIYNAHILDAISDHFEAIGYTPVDPSITTPDLFVLVSVTLHDWTEFPYEKQWWANWSWYTEWPGWTETWNVVYPGHYYDEGYVFSMGTLFIDILDAKHADAAEERIPCHWTAVINGILGYTSRVTLERIDSNIDHAFEQSPYLGRD